MPLDLRARALLGWLIVYRLRIVNLLEIQMSCILLYQFGMPHYFYHFPILGGYVIYEHTRNVDIGE